jgi:hypothetical protein
LKLARIPRGSLHGFLSGITVRGRSYYRNPQILLLTIDFYNGKVIEDLNPSSFKAHRNGLFSGKLTVVGRANHKKCSIFFVLSKLLHSGQVESLNPSLSLQGFLSGITKGGGRSNSKNSKNSKNYSSH